MKISSKLTLFCRVMLLLGLSLGFSAQAQADPSHIAFQGFENNNPGNEWNYVSNPASYNASGDVWSVVTQVGSIHAASEENAFWGMRDLNNPNGGGNFVHTLTFDPINIGSLTNMKIAFDYNGVGYDGGDILAYELFFNQLSQGQTNLITGANGGGVSTSGWETKSISIPNTVSEIKLILSATQNGGSDYAGFDNVRLYIDSNSGGGPTSRPLPLTEGFDDCTLTGWELISVDADLANKWSCNARYSNIEANGYGDAAPANEWLITPPLNMDAQANDRLSFRSYTKFTDTNYPQLSLKYSTDYDGQGNPATASWTALTGFTLSPENSAQWTDSGAIDLSGISGEKVYFAFHYTSSGTTAGSAATWRLDSINFASVAPPPAQPLLLTEIVVQPTAGEFIEIHNPNQTAVDLSNVYLTDATYAKGGVYYYNIVTGANAGGGKFSDFHARFPDGASIAAGAYQTIALNGSANFMSAYGIAPTYELFADSSNNGEQPMREALPGSINGQGGLTNSGELVVLYQWDGASDLVTDLDYVVWGDKAEAVDKTGISVDGPDADSDASSYQADTAIAAQEVIAKTAHATSKSWQRRDLSEGNETKRGGNGAAGHDETSENLATTICLGNPTPNASTNCDGGSTPTLTLIHEVQGTGSSVTKPGTVVTVEGVVVGDYQGSDQLSGFFIQEETKDMDADPNSSEGIFVYCGGCAVEVAEGNVVRVTGMQEEHFNMSQLDVADPQANGSVVVVDGGDNLNLVTPASIDLPAPAATDAADTFEQYEGMLTDFVDQLTVTEYFQLARYGQIVLAEGGKLRQFTHNHAPDAIGYIAHQNDIAKRRIILDDLNNSENSTNPVYHPQPGGFAVNNVIRGGDVVTRLRGVLHWSWAGPRSSNAWRVRPQRTNPVQLMSANPRVATPADVGGDIKLSTFNVLNYFTTIDLTSSRSKGDCGPAKTLDCRGADSQAELARQRSKLAAALLALDADVYGLVELENNAAASLESIVTALNDVAGAGVYNDINTGTIGDDAIKVGLIYKTAVLSPSSSFAVLDSNDFVDANNTGKPRNRPALAQTFKVIQAGNNSFGEQFTVVVNHLKSKGSRCGAGDDDTAKGQGNCNTTRTKAAQKLVDWLATDPTGSNDPDLMILGDLNAYAMEDPIQAVQAGADDRSGTADDYINLIAQFNGADAYSFVFNGQWGYLDHALATQSMASQVVGVTEWHINADESSLLDYNDDIQDAGERSYEVKPSANPLFAPDAYRTSDHDPLLIGLSLRSRQAKISLTKQAMSSTVMAGDTVSFTLTIKNTGQFDLANVVVVDDLVPSCSYTLNEVLPVSKAISYRCSYTNAQTSFTNVATVTALAEGLRLTDVATAAVTVKPQVAMSSSLTIVNATQPSGTGGFAFKGDLGRFTLADQESYGPVNLSPGRYTISEDPASFPDEFWTLLSVACVDGQGGLLPNAVSYNPAAADFTARITLAAEQQLTCTFYNERADYVGGKAESTVFLPIITR